MKKEYVILGLIIIALSAYLVTKKTDRDNYTLPTIPEINVADITEIAIQKGESKQDSSSQQDIKQNGDKDNKILISKKDGSWVVSGAVSDKNYPADQESITKMVDIIKALKLSALVSESGNLAPYELDAKNRINVTVKSKAETVRNFAIGKTAPSFRHTFVALDNSNSVYHAEKSFRNDFDKTINDLRDKKVLSFDKNKISSITLKKGDIVKTVALKDGKPVDDNKDKKPVDGNKDGKTVDNNENEAIVDNKANDALEKILTTLSDLKCHSFTDTESKNEFKEKGIEEISKISIKESADKEISFVIYNKDADGNYPALSSESLYPFFLNTYEGNDIIANIDQSMGIKKEESSNPKEKK
ncbi:MAG: DUF4340 domain-containing protein [Desulfamplus sp.]